MTISIIIAAFNVEDFIYDCLISIYLQKMENIEVIVINDGSTDNTNHLVKKFILKYNLKKNDKWKVFNQNNVGLSVTRNNGINYATGDYIIFLDGDDLLTPNALFDINLKLHRFSNLDMYCFTARCFDGTNNEFTQADEFYSRRFLQEKEYNGLDYYKILESNESFVASACLYAVRSSILKQGLKFLPHIIHEDELFTRQLLLKVENLYFERNPIYLRRIRTGSITTSPVSNKKIESLLVISNELSKTPIFRKSANNFYKMAVKMYLGKSNSKALLGIRLLLNYNFSTIKHKKEVLKKIIKSV